MRRKLTVSEPVAVGADETVYAIALPTPFSVGSVNVYLVEDDPLTLVDCGPNSATCFRELERALECRGHRIADVGLLLITHQHLDHVGLARFIAERSGAQVGCLRALAPYLANWDVAAAQDDEYAYELMLLHGVDARVAQVLRTVARTVRGWGAPTEVHKLLDDGGSVSLRERTLRVAHRPGHSPSDTVFYCDAAGIAFGGDVLVRRVASPTLLARPLDPFWGEQRPRPLVDYRRSLRALSSPGIGLVLPGHGPPIEEPAELIESRLSEQDRHAQRLLDLLGEGPMTAYQLTVAARGEIAFAEVFTTLSETLGTLDLLLDARAVVEHAGESRTVFEAA